MRRRGRKGRRRLRRSCLRKRRRRRCGRRRRRGRDLHDRACRRRLRRFPSSDRDLDAEEPSQELESDRPPPPSALILLLLELVSSFVGDAAAAP